MDKYIDFSKLDVPDLRSYGDHNMGMYNMDDDVAATAKQLERDEKLSDDRSVGHTAPPKFAEVAAEDVTDVRKPNKRAGKSKTKVVAAPVTASPATTPSPRVAKNKVVEEAKGAKEAPAAEVEVVSTDEPAPKRRASKKNVKDLVPVDAGQSKEDLEIKEMVSDRR